MGGDALRDRILDEIVASPRSSMIAHKISRPLKTALPCRYLTAGCHGGGEAMPSFLLLPAQQAARGFCTALTQTLFSSPVRISHTSHGATHGVVTPGLCQVLELHPTQPWLPSPFAELDVARSWEPKGCCHPSGLVSGDGCPLSVHHQGGKGKVFEYVLSC